MTYLKNKQATTTSQMVAEKFNKNHQHVMRDIRKLHEELGLSKIGLTKFKEMFRESAYFDSMKINKNKEHKKNSLKFREMIFMFN